MKIENIEYLAFGYLDSKTTKTECLDMHKHFDSVGIDQQEKRMLIITKQCLGSFIDCGFLESNKDYSQFNKQNVIWKWYIIVSNKLHFIKRGITYNALFISKIVDTY